MMEFVLSWFIEVEHNFTIIEIKVRCYHNNNKLQEWILNLLLYDIQLFKSSLFVPIKRSVLCHCQLLQNLSHNLIHINCLLFHGPSIKPRYSPCMKSYRVYILYISVYKVNWEFCKKITWFSFKCKWVAFTFFFFPRDGPFWNLLVHHIPILMTTLRSFLCEHWLVSCMHLLPNVMHWPIIFHIYELNVCIYECVGAQWSSPKQDFSEKRLMFLKKD